MFRVVSKLGNVALKKSLQNFVGWSYFKRRLCAIQTEYVKRLELAHLGQTVVKWFGSKLDILAECDFGWQLHRPLQFSYFAHKFCKLAFWHQVNIDKQNRSHASLYKGHYRLVRAISEGKLKVFYVQLKHLFGERLLTQAVEYSSKIRTKHKVGICGKPNVTFFFLLFSFQQVRVNPYRHKSKRSTYST